jgi:yeast amino acid transporter
MVGSVFFGVSDFRGSICFAHIRFRKAWLVQGNSLDEIPFKAAFGVAGSWVGLMLCILCLMAQLYVALFPIGGSPNVSAFFQAYLAAPIILAFYIFWKVFKQTRFIRADEVDLISGRHELNLKEILEKERAERSHWANWKKYVILHEKG